MKDTEAALKWIVGILRSHNMPFEISGGFAARLYGSSRELADIDIDVPSDRISELSELVKDYSKYGLQYYKDEQFDLMIVSLNYKGQDIDITPETVKIFNSTKKVWVNSTVDLQKATEKEINNITNSNIPL